jgi:glycosyltransferase involved in cell wall biosynthesis
MSTSQAEHAAAALARADLLERYHTPLVPSAEKLRRLERALPARLANPVLRELHRRKLPPEVSPGRAESVGTASDLVRVAIQRRALGPRVKRRVDRWVIESFDRGVASALREGDGALFAIAGFAGRATVAARSLGITPIVSCPLGHHAFVRDLMREEAQLRPEWASTLQLHDAPDWWLETHTRELEAADRVFAVSRFSASTLVEREVPEEKIELTYLGVDAGMFTPAPRPADGTFRVIFVGQITQRKGLSYLVEGFERAGLENSELVLLGHIIGDPSPWAGRPKIIHVAALPRVELPPQYHRADVYVLPSLVEGFPMTAVEAMACGVPTIVSENTFADEVITDGVDGFIVPIRDADAITERLRLLAADPELRVRMGAAARRTAEQFDWARYGERIVKLMQGILDDARSEPIASPLPGGSAPQSPEESVRAPS